MSGYSIEKSKKHVNELNEKTEKDKIEVENLEQGKNEIIDARTEIEGADISGEAKEKIAEVLGEEGERLSETAKDKSDEIGNTLKEFEEEIQHIQEANENTKAEEKKLRDRKAVLEHIKMGGTMDGAISEATEESARIEELNSEAIKGRKESEDLARRLSVI